LRVSARARKGAHINDEPHVVGFKQVNKDAERPNRMTNRKERISHLCLTSRASQRRPLVQGDVIGLIALNFVLGVVLAGVMSITFVIQIFGVHFHNLAADPASLRVPDYAIADLETLFHRSPAVLFRWQA
jgi:hypothetical protein